MCIHFKWNIVCKNNVERLRNKIKELNEIGVHFIWNTVFKDNIDEYKISL